MGIVPMAARYHRNYDMRFLFIRASKNDHGS